MVSANHVRRDRGGFTLIEVLVVVAMIALLTAILLPSLRSARDASKAAVCLSNMRQIGVSMRMYADENNGAVVALMETSTGFVHWIELLRKYIATTDVCRCPADLSTTWEADPFAPTAGLRTTSYVTNNRMTPEQGITKLSQIRRPTEKILMAEFLDNHIGDHFHPESWSLFLSQPEDEIAVKRHLKKANYWFLDGHAEPLFFESTWNIDGTVDRYDPKR